MSIANSYSPSKWLYLKELLTIGLLEGIPRKPGVILRSLIYRKVFARIGKSVQIQQDVEIISAHSIEMGDEVTIDRNARLNSYGENNRILIGDCVKIDASVFVVSTGGNSQIILKDQVFLARGADLSSLGGFIEVGENSFIGPYSCVAGPGPIRIGKDCLIAAHSGIFANNHQFADPTRKIVDQELTCKGITIEDDCWLGAGVKVLDGVTIGRGSVIGAGAVVTKDIPPFSVAVGVPAKVISHRDKVHKDLAEVEKCLV
ncbi:MAG: acyltransferase [Coleofasciculus sp. Co-bin14]|nr:acyltransferase [Coleofasciculus sp. Co-bin14]